MANLNAFLQTFSGGEFGKAMSSRVAVESYQAASEIFENWLPKAQGPMSRRPSLEYIDSATNSALRGKLKKFEFDVGQNYLLYLTENTIEFYLNDGMLSIPEVSALITNGGFGTFTGWTDNSGSGSSASASGGKLVLTSNGASDAIARTTFTVNEANTLHVIDFDIDQGPVHIRVGTSAGASNLLNARDLRRGTHRLSFTPTSTGTHHLQFWYGGKESKKLIDNVQFLPGPVFTVPSPWAEDDLFGVYTAQDGDRLFMLHRDYAPRVLERRDHRSWSLIHYEPDDGPFELGTFGVKLTPDDRAGQASITSSGSIFSSDDVRRLLRLTHSGQYTRKNAAGDSVYTDPVKVTGVGADRIFRASITGTFTGTVTLERSNGNQNDFSKVITFTGASNETYNDSYAIADTGKGGTSDGVYTASQSGSVDGRMDNTTCYYRLAVYPGEWTSGSATLELSSDSGSQVGIARILSYVSATEVTVEIIKPFARAGASDVWDISAWSDINEWPNVCAFAHGRIWMARRRQLWSSVSDDYFSMADGVDADRSVQITLRSKSAEGIRWMRELDFLCIGTQSEEFVIRSTNLSEPVGPTTTEPSLQGEEGSAGLEAEIAGDSIIYIHRNLRRVMQFAHNTRALSEDSFVSVDLNRLNPETCQSGIVSFSVQQEPDRRIFAILKDGRAKPALFRREEEIMAWGSMRTKGLIEDSITMRENDEDAVYWLIRRYIGGQWVRMIERSRSEISFNPEDMVHLDSMLETAIERPDVGITPSSIVAGPVTITATDDVFEIGHEGMIMWVDGGKITIDNYVSAMEVEGTIDYPLLGEVEDPTVKPSVFIPRYIPGGQWGLASEVNSVSGLDHLEGEEVQIWADCAYAGTATVSGGEVDVPDGSSRVFVGLGFQSIWKSLKLAYGGQKGTAMNQPKSVQNMGWVLSDTADNLYAGSAPGKMSKLVTLSQSSVLGNLPRFFTGEKYAKFDGTNERDPRIIIATVNPGPATIDALIPNIQINE